MDTLISGATVVTMNEGMEVLLGGFVGITDGKIVYLSKEAPKEKPAAIVDGSGMVLLEGLDLSGVEEGTYFLLAVPLKIDGADGSPVRAILLERQT